MPGFVTHYYFGQMTARQLTDKHSRHLIRDHREAFNLGLEGPDVFFYHIPCHFIGERNIGNVMHDTSVMMFFENLFNARNGLDDAMDRKIADAYILGFIGHYTLDTNCHPYIFYRSNHLKAKATKGGTFDFGNHVTLETDIDHTILRHYMHKSPTEFDYRDAVFVDGHELTVISELLESAIANTYGENISAYRIASAIGSFTRLNRAMRDPYGIKKTGVRIAEDLIFGHSIISAMIPNDNIVKFKDPCNLKHRKWHNPWNPADESSKSVMDILEDTVPTYENRINMYMDSIHATAEDSLNDCLKKRNALLEELSDLSYSTGLPLEDE